MAITMEELRKKAQRYDEALEKAKRLYEKGTITESLGYVFPELKESDDERVRKALIRFHKSTIDLEGIKGKDIIAWLEKQVPVDEDKIVKGIKRGVAISLMNHIDANSKGMCLSNMECEDIENAIINEDWDKVYGYMKKKLSQQEVTKKSDQEEGFIEIPFGAYDSDLLRTRTSFPKGVMQ